MKASDAGKAESTQNVYELSQKNKNFIKNLSGEGIYCF